MPKGVYKRGTIKRKPIIKKGDKFNRLTAIKFSYKKGTRQFWNFRCDCGKEKIISVSNVKNGSIKSCGCLYKVGNKNKNFRHGMIKTRIYKTWDSMKDRCSNKNHKFYNYYGKRGIKICKRWLKFENFYKDMGERPENKSLDRIKNNLGYYKENCCWSSPKEQGSNKRNNVFLTYKNKTQTIAQWSRELKVKRHIIYKMIENNRVGNCKANFQTNKK